MPLPSHVDLLPLSVETWIELGGVGVKGMREDVMTLSSQIRLSNNEVITTGTLQDSAA